MKNNFSAPQNFRVIDTETGEVVNKHFCILPNGVLACIHRHNVILEASKLLYIPSASIGMKDSKGVEIYAGDIVEYKVANLNYPIGQVDTLGRKCIKPALGVAIWKDYKYTIEQLAEGEIECGSPDIYNKRKKLSIDFYNYTETNIGWNEYDWNKLIVIGNIYKSEYKQYLDQLEK